MARPQKPEIMKAIDDAEAFLRMVEGISSLGAVADISLYWAKYHARASLKFLRDAASEQGAETRDFVIYRETADGKTNYEIVSNPEEKWKILHDIKETEDERRKPWLRAYRERSNNS